MRRLVISGYVYFLQFEPAYEQEDDVRERIIDDFQVNVIAVEKLELQVFCLLQF